MAEVQRQQTETVIRAAGGTVLVAHSRLVATLFLTPERADAVARALQEAAAEARAQQRAGLN